MEIGSHFIGQVTELQVASECIKRGIMVSKPLVPSSRYDLIIEIDGKLLKIQVKTCHSNGSDEYFEIDTQTSHTNCEKTVHLSYSKNEVDFFATIYNGICYLIPYDICGKRSQRLRLLPTKNNQTKGIVFAKDYTLDNILNSLCDAYDK